MLSDFNKIRRDIEYEKALHKTEKKFRFFVLLLAFFVIMASMLSLFVIGGTTVNGDSMYPEMKNGDFAVYSLWNRKIIEGDIIVIQDEVNARHDIKRVIALEGDVVELTHDGGVLVNGLRLNEPYVQHSPTMKHDIAFPQTVPKGHFFVLGDNRRASKDSRDSAIGMIAEEKVRGAFLFFLRFD